MGHKARLGILAALTLLAMAAFMTVGLGDNLAFLLPFRGKKLLAMLLVGGTVGMSTLVFQTLTTNRILTPAVIGLDNFYLLTKMAVIFFVGSAAHLAQPPLWQFFIDSALMSVAATLLFTLLLPLLARDIYRLLLAGLIFGVLCQKLTDLMGRMMDPNDYSVFQALAFAQFNRPRSELLLPAGIIILAIAAVLWRKRHVLDIMALGRAQAISLGVVYQREFVTLMLLVSLLVAVSTALVGPMHLFGLLVSAFAYRLFPTPYHRILLPASMLLAACILLSGQTLFEHVFGFAGTLSIVIEGLGGVVFLYLLLSRRRS